MPFSQPQDQLSANVDRHWGSFSAFHPRQVVVLETRATLNLFHEASRSLCGLMRFFAVGCFVSVAHTVVFQLLGWFYSVICLRRRFKTFCCSSLWRFLHERACWERVW